MIIEKLIQFVFSFGKKNTLISAFEIATITNNTAETKAIIEPLPVPNSVE